MLKVIHLIKRKPHLTHEQFRAHFEASHAAMALKFCGHLFVDYQRNYVTTVYGGGDARVEGSGYGPMEWDWDLMSEWTVADEAALNEIYRIMERLGSIFKDLKPYALYPLDDYFHGSTSLDLEQRQETARDLMAGTMNLVDHSLSKLLDVPGKTAA